MLPVALLCLASRCWAAPNLYRSLPTPWRNILFTRSGHHILGSSVSSTTRSYRTAARPRSAGKLVGRTADGDLMFAPIRGRRLIAAFSTERSVRCAVPRKRDAALSGSILGLGNRPHAQATRDPARDGLPARHLPLHQAPRHLIEHDRRVEVGRNVDRRDHYPSRSNRVAGTRSASPGRECGRGRCVIRLAHLHELCRSRANTCSIRGGYDERWELCAITPRGLRDPGQVPRVQQGRACAVAPQRLTVRLPARTGASTDGGADHRRGDTLTP